MQEIFIAINELLLFYFLKFNSLTIFFMMKRKINFKAVWWLSSREVLPYSVVPWLMGPDTGWSRELSYTFQMTRTFFHKKYRRSFKTLREGIVHIPEKKEQRTWPGQTKCDPILFEVAFLFQNSCNFTRFSWSTYVL